MHARKRATRSRIHLHSLSIAEALSAVIGPWCHTIGQTIRGTIHPLLLETIRPSSPGASTHRRLLSSLGISTSRQLNKHNSWLCRPAVTMRALRKEIPKIRDTSIVRPALSLSRLLRMDYTSTCHRGFTIHEKPFESEREKTIVRTIRWRDSLLLSDLESIETIICKICQ